MNDASNWPGGIIHESIDAWITRQPWTEEGKAAARELVRLRGERRLNNPTSGEWNRIALHQGWNT